MSARLNRTADPKPTKLLLARGLIVGFCTTPEAEAALIAADVTLIWLQGRMAETLDDAVMWLRKRRGTLAIAEDLRCFGEKKAAIFAQVHRLEAARIGIVDVRDPAASHMVLMERAEKKLQAGSEGICRKTRQRRGAKGGTAKRDNAAARRNALIADDIAARLCHHPKLTWNDRLEILGEFFSLATIKRVYA